MHINANHGIINMEVNLLAIPKCKISDAPAEFILRRGKGRSPHNQEKK
jgi:hypothetical protein